MSEILDTIEEEMPNMVFSKLSFGMAIITSTLLSYFFSILPSEIKASELPFFHPALIWITSLSAPIGFLFSIISFVKKEPSSIIKWIGGIINTLIFLLFAVVFVMMFKK
jgi:hypothetical protein